MLLITAFLLLSLALKGSSTLLSIQSPDGDIIDCIDIRDQPTLRDPVLRHLKIQKPPTEFPNKAESETKLKFQVWHRNGSSCPKGTIPLRRVPGLMDGTTGSDDGPRVTDGHQHALGSTTKKTKIHGTKVTMNVWRPKIGGPGQFSLGQTWVVAGSYEDEDLNTLEAGWQVFPDLYLDDQPRFFVFWTRDAYTLTRCYNMRCAGFIQTSRKVVIEGAISPVSSFEGDQIDLTIQIWKDSKLRVWWLGIGLSSGHILEPVGYWPFEILTHLTKHAEAVQWGGEIFDNNISGGHTTTQMGSGYLPDSGFGKSAYMRDLMIATSESKFVPVFDMSLIPTDPAHYQVMKSSDTSFYYGGQEDAGAVSIRSHSIFLCILLHLLFFI